MPPPRPLWSSFALLILAGTATAYFTCYTGINGDYSITECPTQKCTKVANSNGIVKTCGLFNLGLGAKKDECTKASLMGNTLETCFCYTSRCNNANARRINKASAIAAVAISIMGTKFCATVD